MELNPRHPTEPNSVEEASRAAVVVVGVDASECSWNAFSWSCGEAGRLGALLVAVFVSPDVGLRGGLAAASSLLGGCVVDLYWMELTAIELKTEGLQAQLSDAAADASVEFEFVHAKGETAAQILRIAAARKADLIVVGQSSKVFHHLARSLGRRLIGDRNAPVVVVVP
jgi:nucleotide-binding universal stress UspA family protein